jgi:Flp pilus assembly protein TadB
MEMKGVNELIIAGFIEVGFLLTPVIFGWLDFISGVRKAKQRGEAITSDGWKRSVKKVAGYYNMLLALVVVDCMQMGCFWFLNSYYGYNIPTFPFITLVGALVVAAIEIKSIREKAEDKVKKQMNDVAALIIEVLKHNSDPSGVAKVVGDYMNKTDKE